MSDLLASFGLDADIASLLAETVENPSEFSVSDNTWITANKEVVYKGSVNGTPVSAKILLHPGATLNRISAESRKRFRNAGNYLLVSGTMRDVKMDISILHENEWISFLDFFKLLSGNISRSDAEMEIALRNMNVNIMEPQTLMFQQFGADESAYESLIELLQNNGFNQTTVPNSNVINAFTSSQGVPVTGFQVGKMNRTESRPYGKRIADTDKIHQGQGFSDFIDAQVQKYLLSAMIGKETALLEKARAEHRNTLTEDQMAQISDKLDANRQMRSNIAQRGSGWSGVQREVEVDDLLQEVTEKNVFWTQRAPIGRFNLTIAGVDSPISLWRDRTNEDGTPNTIKNEPKPTMTNPFEGIEAG